MGGIFFAAHRGKNKGFSTLIRTVIRGLQKNGYKKTPQEDFLWRLGQKKGTNTFVSAPIFPSVFDS